MRATSILPALAALLLSLAMLPAGGCDGRDAPAKTELKVYCAAGIQQPISEIASAFERGHAEVTVAADFAGGSGTQLGKIRTADAHYRPDIYVAGDEFYGDRARELGLVDRVETLGYFVPVIAVKKGNQASIHKLADLRRAGLQLVLGDDRKTAIGKATAKILARAGLEDIENVAKVSRGGTVQELAIAVSDGPADATIIWDATARQGRFPERLETFEIPNAPIVRMVICRVAGTPRRELADAFIDQALSAQAKASFVKFGFTVALPATAPADTEE